MSPELEWLNSYRQRDIRLMERAKKLYLEDKPDGVPWKLLSDRERDYYSAVIVEYDKAHISVEAFTEPGKVLRGESVSNEQKQVNEVIRRKIWS